MYRFRTPGVPDAYRESAYNLSNILIISHIAIWHEVFSVILFKAENWMFGSWYPGNQVPQTVDPKNKNLKIMFRNYIKIALRGLVKNRTFSLVNILGLAVGIWVSFIGAPIAFLAIVGWYYEYYRGNFAR